MNGMVNVLLAMPQQEDEKFIDVIRRDFEAAGVSVGRMDIRSKALVRQYLEMFKDTNVLILTQHQANESYTPQELDELSMILEADQSCLIPILDEKKGSDYLRQLDSMAIYTAIFEDDADYATIAGLILNGRSKKEARAYYGIMGKSSAAPIHANEFDINSSVRYLVAADGNYKELESRVLILANRLGSTSQLLKVFGELPDDCFMLVSRMDKYKELCRLVLEKRSDMTEYLEEEGSHDPPHRIAGAEKFKMIKKTSVDREEERSGAVNIGVISTNVGVGCTYTAILLAHTLSKKGSVAIIEFDNCDEHFENLCRCVNGVLNVTGVTEFKIGKVNYFYHIPYSRCCVQICPCFDYVIYDFGCANDEVIDKFFLNMDQKFVVTGGGDWRLGELAEFIHEVSCKDTEGQFQYVIPLIHERELHNYKELVGDNTLAAIPYEENPYRPSIKTQKLFTRIMTGNYVLRKRGEIGIAQKASRDYFHKGKPLAVLFCAVCLLAGNSLGSYHGRFYQQANKEIEQDLLRERRELNAVSNENENLKNQLDSLVVTAYIPKSFIQPGTTITDDMLDQVKIYSSIHTSNYLSKSEIGKVSAQIGLETGVPILQSMVKTE